MDTCGATQMRAGNYHWIPHVLLNVKEFADENGLPRLSKSLKTAIVEFYFDISDSYVDPDRPTKETTDDIANLDNSKKS